MHKTFVHPTVRLLWLPEVPLADLTLWSYATCTAYGVQLPVDGESLSGGDTAVFTEP